MRDLMLALPLVSLAALIILNITSRERFKERRDEHHRAHIQHSTASAANKIPEPEDEDLSIVQELVKRSFTDKPSSNNPARNPQKQHRPFSSARHPQPLTKPHTVVII